jgi:hypothetical protein
VGDRGARAHAPRRGPRALRWHRRSPRRADRGGSATSSTATTSHAT